MWLIKACLMFVIIIQFMQHSECRRRGGKRHNALSPHLRFRELTKSKGSRALQVSSFSYRIEWMQFKNVCAKKHLVLKSHFMVNG